MLVGNKSDLKHLRAVPTAEAQAFSEDKSKLDDGSPSSNPIRFIETSALDSTNVENAFQKILTDIYQLVATKALEGGDSIKPSNGETISVTPTSDSDGKKSSCC